MQILRRETYRRMPWKNGQGMTEEIAIFPPESGMDDFDWRLSIAHVGADGPFSLFPGIDRSLALLDGGGMALSLPDGQSETLTKAGQPFAFSGDCAISSRNLTGKTIDLNFMTRRGRFRHKMHRQQHLTLANRGEAAVSLVIFNQDATVIDKDQTLSLHRFDTIILQHRPEKTEPIFGRKRSENNNLEYHSDYDFRHDALEPGEPWSLAVPAPSNAAACDLLIVTLEREE